MAKPDWGELQQRFLSDHVKTGISPKDWCESQGLKYASAKRYIKIANGSANSQKKTANKTANSQSKKAPNPAAKNAEELPEKRAAIAESEIKDDIFDPSDFGLSGQQGKFAEAVAKGKTLIEAYRLADYAGEGNTAYSNASRMLRNARVLRAIRWLRDHHQKRLALTEREIIHQLSSIASIDANAFSQIRRVNCRYCWGEGHNYQWRDIEEQLQAERRAEADNRPPPDVSGGVGFVAITIPNDECPRCHGEGVMETFYADTTQLDGPERWAYLGVEETMNGLKVKIASPEAARKELLAYIKATKGKLPAGGTGGEPISEKEQLELEGMRLRNERIRAEINHLSNLGAGEDHTIIHNSMPLDVDNPDEPEE
ncbi:TPA: terminase small subunit [Enterobacter kobei]|nr:terminase small subunit [Enterobacter kobei]